MTAKGINVDEFKSGGLHEKHTVTTNWYLGTNSAFAKGQENLRKKVPRWPFAGLS
jgi:hypothetical protein